MYYIYCERNISAKVHLKVWRKVNHTKYFSKNRLTTYNVVKLFPAGSIFKHIIHLENYDVFFNSHVEQGKEW